MLMENGLSAGAARPADTSPTTRARAQSVERANCRLKRLNRGMRLDEGQSRATSGREEPPSFAR